METPQLKNTVKVPLRCRQVATPAEIMSAVEKTRQMYRCSLLEEHHQGLIFQLMECTVARLRQICQEWSELGTKFDLNPLRDAIHMLISALQRRCFLIVEEVETSLRQWEHALFNVQRVKEHTYEARPVYVPGLRTYSVGYRIHPQNED